MSKELGRGEMLVYDRMCENGGWNYGNSKVLGEALWPYPDVTAVALIALQDRAASEANQKSLRALDAHDAGSCFWHSPKLGYSLFNAL